MMSARFEEQEEETHVRRRSSYRALAAPPQDGLEDVAALAALVCAAPLARVTFLDASGSTRVASNGRDADDGAVRPIAVVTLNAGNGQAVGEVLVLDRVARDLTPAQAEGLQALARHASVLLEAARVGAERARAAGAVVSAAKVGHDLNNLLSPILGFGALVEAALPAGTEAHDDMTEVLAAANRVAAFAAELVDRPRS